LMASKRRDDPGAFPFHPFPKNFHGKVLISIRLITIANIINFIIINLLFILFNKIIKLVEWSCMIS
jgi:hypothetical protein